MLEEYEKIKEYRGPKKPFKIILPIIIILFFLLGFTLVRTETMPTGHVISGIDLVKLLGFLFLMVSIILALLLLKKPKK